MPKNQNSEKMSEHSGIVNRWLKRTQEVLLLELERKNVKDTQALKRSIQTRMSEEGPFIRAEIAFLTRGRFVDMGAGRKAKVQALSKRKPKKWYSPAFYGRLNMLQGALGLQMMEEAVSAIKDIEDDGSTRG